MTTFVNIPTTIAKTRAAAGLEVIIWLKTKVDGSFDLISDGPDVFISKLDASGNFVWAKGFDGGMSPGCGTPIALDNSGNIYTTGFFFDTVDFDPGPAVSTLSALIQ